MNSQPNYGGALGNGGGVYLLPDDANTLVHVNANDLRGGTARIGPAWTQNGTVPFNDGGGNFPSSSGVFSASNYYSQPSSSPANLAAPPFTAVIIFNAVSFSNDPVLLFTGPDTAYTGFSVQFLPSGALLLNIGIASAETANVAVAGQLGVAIVGQDAAGILYCALNGGATATLAGTALSPSGVGPIIGVYSASALLPFNGTISEVTISTDVPSGAAFAALYARIQAQFVNPHRYLIPQTANVLTHVSGTDLANGTAKAGGAWTKNGTITLNVGDFPVPTVGPLTDSNNLFQASSSPANVAAPPFTVAMLVNPVALTSSNVILSTGIFNLYGYYLQFQAGGFYFATNSTGVNDPVITANGAVPGQVNVVTAGMDASGNLFAQLNGGPVATVSGASLLASISQSYIGEYAGGVGQSADGNAYEVMVSTDVPSAASLQALTKSIVANIPGLNRYNIPTTPNVLNHVNALDLYSGTAKAGTPWAADGVAPINISASGPPAATSVGPLSDTVYFNQAGPFVNAGPWTAVLIFDTTNTNQVFYLSNGLYQVDGWYVYGNVGGAAGITINGGGIGAINTTANNVVAGLNVLIFGFDAGGSSYIQLNGGATAVLGSGLALTPSTSNLLLGRYTTTGSGSLANVHEVMVSTDVPSAGAFSTLYAAVAANLG